MIRYGSWATLFALASIGLGVLLWLRIETLRLPPAAENPDLPKTHVASSDRTPAKPRLDHLSAYSAIAQRPLFSSTRRPVVPPPPKPSAPRKNLAKLVLAGIIVSDKEKTALLREANSSTTQWLSEGQTIGGWRIDKILHSSVIFVSGKDTAEIALWDETHSSAAPETLNPSGPKRPSAKGARSAK